MCVRQGVGVITCEVAVGGGHGFVGMGMSLE